MANLDNTRIKSIQVQITKLEEEIRNYNLQLNDIQSNIASKRKQIKKHNKELTKLKQSSKDIIISEHAIVRYVERVLKIDMDKLSKEIIGEDLKNTVTTLGNGTYPYKNHFIRVVDNVIVTVTSKDEI